MKFGEKTQHEDDKDKIMHATLIFGKNTIMVCDSPTGMEHVIGTNVNLSLNIEDESAASETFSSLSEGGTVTMPFEPQFWGAKFGSLIDKFGVRWMINCELTSK